MKFTDGFWQLRPGVTALYAQQAYDVQAGGHELTVTAPTKVIESRGDTLNRPSLTVTVFSPLDDVSPGEPRAGTSHRWRGGPDR